MPDGQKVVQVPGVGNIAFPATMADADINAAITNHLNSQKTGAFQQRPGGPVLNAKDIAAPADEGPTLSSVAREGARGATSAIIPEDAQSASGRGNLETIGRGLNEQVNTAATTPWGQGGPLWGVISMLAKGIMGGARGVASGAGEMGSGVVNLDSEKTAHGGGALLGNLATLGLLRKAPEAGPSITSRGEFTLGDPMGRESVQNMMNQGPAKADFIGRQAQRASSVQSAVKSTLDAVHEDGKGMMSNVSQTIDAAEPNGAFNRADVQGAVKDAMGVVKAEQRVPAAITKVLEAGEPTGPRSTGPTVGGRHFDLSNPSDLKAYQRLKASGAFTPEEVKRMEGGGGEGKMSFEELKQIHSDIGKQIANSEGAVEAGVKTAYAKLDEMLRNKAESHGMLNEWTEGRNKVKTFYDTAYRSPLKDTYFGGDHGKIMKPLISDDLGPQVKTLLDKIAPYGLDTEKLQQTVNGYRYGERMDMLNEPSRMTPILAAISPKMAAIRVGLPRIMRTHNVTEHLYGKGLENVPEVPASKIYPSSKAAAKASTKGNPIPPGNKTPFGGGGGSEKVVKRSMLEDTVARDEQALKDKGLAKAERTRIERHLADFRQMLEENQ